MLGVSVWKRWKKEERRSWRRTGRRGERWVEGYRANLRELPALGFEVGDGGGWRSRESWV